MKFCGNELLPLFRAAAGCIWDRKCFFFYQWCVCVCVFMCLLIVLETLTDFFRDSQESKNGGASVCSPISSRETDFLWSGGASVCSSISSGETDFLGFSIKFLSMDSMHCISPPRYRVINFIGPTG